MYIVKWLTKHPLIAIWVLGAVAILLTRYNWQDSHETSETGHQEVASLAEEHAENLGSRDRAEPQGNDVSNVNQSAPVSQELESTISSAVSEETLPVKVEASTKPLQAELAKQATQEIAAQSDSQQSAEIAAQGTIAVETPRQLAATQTVSTQNESVTEASGSAGLSAESTDVEADLTNSSNEDLLLMAREAYWNNGLDEAAAIYSRLIEMEPDVLEYKGELGNVYWRQGFPKKAAELYSQIAIPMIQKGDGERVANMIGFIGLFFPDQAAEINRQLQVHSGSD